MIIYYTGTGNSRHCAEFLADRLSDELLDSFGFIRNGIAGEFISGKAYVFVCPIYGWRIPRIFEEFIRSANFDGESDAYFVITCGSDIGAASERLQALCRDKGLNFKGAAPIVMPENYIALFEAPDEKQEAKLMSLADKTLGRVAAKIEKGESLKAQKITLADRLKSGIVNEFFYKFTIKAKPFFATDACTSCGLCESRCPLGNIAIENGKPRWGDSCTHCMACISYCPAEAIEYGRSTKGKRRYRCK